MLVYETLLLANEVPNTVFVFCQKPHIGTSLIDDALSLKNLLSLQFGLLLLVCHHLLSHLQGLEAFVLNTLKLLEPEVMHVASTLHDFIFFDFKVIQLLELVLDHQVPSALRIRLFVDNIHVLIFSIDLVNIFNVLNPLQIHHSMPFKFRDFFISIFASVTYS